MGIPRFFYYCYNNFDSSIELVKSSLPQDSFLHKDPVDFIYFDLNAIIHPVCQKVFKYGSHEDTSVLRPKPVRVTATKIQEVYQKVCEEIEKYVNIVLLMELLACLNAHNKDNVVFALILKMQTKQIKMKK